LIERHITFNVHPDRTAAFEQFIGGEYRPAMATAPGFVRCELLREADSPTRYQLVFRFEDADKATAWRTSEVHQALQPALKELHVDMVVQAYEVVS
jgi:antibiotic biosynthesis monooxygenase (ABM) superfamily enzyme